MTVIKVAKVPLLAVTDYFFTLWKDFELSSLCDKERLSNTLDFAEWVTPIIAAHYPDEPIAKFLQVAMDKFRLKFGERLQ